MIIGLTGNLGSGKTLSMVELMLLLKNQMEVYTVSNIHMSFSDKTIESVKEMDQVTMDHEGVIGIDEVWAWADSRKSQNNDVITQIVIYSRKRGWIIIYTTQSLHQVDKRLRENTDFIGMCEHTSSPTGDKAKVTLVNMNSMEIANVLEFNPEPLYDVYDTKEEVDVKSKKQKLKPIIEKFEKKRDQYDTKKSMKADIMLEHSHEISQNDAGIVVEKVMGDK